MNIVDRMKITRNANRILPRDGVYAMTGASNSICNQLVDAYMKSDKLPNAALIYKDKLYFLWTASITPFGIEGKVNEVVEVGNKEKVLERVVKLYVEWEKQDNSGSDDTTICVSVSDSTLDGEGWNDFRPTPPEGINEAYGNLVSEDATERDRINQVLAQSVLDMFDIRHVVYVPGEAKYQLHHEGDLLGCVFPGSDDTGSQIILWAIRTLKIG